MDKPCSLPDLGRLGLFFTADSHYGSAYLDLDALVLALLKHLGVNDQWLVHENQSTEF